MEEESEGEFLKLKVLKSRKRRRLYIEERSLVKKMYSVGGADSEVEAAAEETKAQAKAKAKPVSALYDKDRDAAGEKKGFRKNQMKK